MAKDPMDYIHAGKRHWWTGIVTTDCGLTLPKETRWVFRGPNCPACKAARNAR